MVKTDQAVLSVVTIQAVIPEVLYVTGHKSGVVTSMANKAGVFLNRILHILRVVTRAAVHHSSLIVNRVADQAEAGFCMVKMVQGRRQYIK